MKALHCAFPNSPHLYCTLHLQENVRDYLSRVGVSENDRKTVLDWLFGKAGLAASQTMLEFENRRLEAMQQLRLLDSDDLYTQYISEKVTRKIKNNVEVRQRACGVEKLWTNNNSESANHMLKLKLEWKPAHLLDLVHHLHDLVKLQYADLQAALYGQGNYILASPFSRHIMHFAEWANASEAKRQLKFQAFLNDNGHNSLSRTVTSTDGQLTLYASPKIATKPNQRRRARPCRTQTQ